MRQSLAHSTGSGPLHIKAVAGLYLLVGLAEAEDLTHFSRGAERDRPRPIELRAVPVQFGERENLLIQEAHALLSSFDGDVCGPWDIQARIRFKKWDASPGVEQGFILGQLQHSAAQNLG